MTTQTAAPPSTTPRAARRPREGTNRALWGSAGVLSLILVLELLPRSGAVDARFLPPFSEIAAALADRITTGEFWTALGDTLVTWAIGFSIALVAGIVLGMVIGSVGILRDATASTIEFLRPIPSVALIPLAVLMLGTGRPGTLLLVVYATFWQVLVQVLYGVQDVDPVARDTARSYRFRFLTTARTVVWPTTLPFAMTGFRLGATVALILTITGELIIGTPGLGRLLAVAQQSGQVSSMYALVIVTGLIGVLVNLGARAVERRVLHWHSSVRRETAS
ncbi:ABC transporter permease [Nesterenkonia sp. HG001]|uniref:ABC transporter permease n=1 Tax=Nesterenkonia sp. HG001 TaxID=2983207 RepID=UPI002AC5648C|nr:ABC transporter permease [Nesterenkonia sp. HG001]MDZ5077328.1 ABC transporter permease [Nesterenkonia sp. HG001]